ncbi:hypothetical protein NSK_006055 [Nannochloropsis salina CCMP1776]|uniref:Uncharacterized protein n=1 Tax=Nannochloropsis salina CCMP1776 TaxID=1027361 RepID=A0A4D9CTQ2_9STRA|nr:hypothetical protein NSK_006055 [Nannochloropsis salina CCMP1776]|eukprot:TFJ82631.1 hypothetical protein NSK_006055 [Nannochloropsis salina CCMP1776]
MKKATANEKNLETISTFLLPFVAMIYLGIVLKKYPLEEYADIVTNEYLLLGFKNVEALRRHLVDNLIGSCVWGLTFMYIRKMANPELRQTAWKNTQDGYFATITTFVTGLLKAACNNFANRP